MTMTDERLAELDAVMAKARALPFATVEWEVAFTVARLAAYNAYTDLRAHIDEQAATIARLTALMMDVDGISDAISESFDVDWSSRDGARHVVGYFETEIARAALAGAA